MSVDCFLDTNILVYAVSSAEGDAAKSTKALDLAPAYFGRAICHFTSKRTRPGVVGSSPG